MTKNTTFRLADDVRTPVCDVILIYTVQPKAGNIP
jgi:hypothetical protein